MDSPRCFPILDRGRYFWCPLRLQVGVGIKTVSAANRLIPQINPAVILIYSKLIYIYDSYGHIYRNTPDPVRSPKLSR